MKFKQMEGCTIGYYLEVDGEEFYELPEEKKNEIINYLLVKLKENYKNNGIGIRNILETFQYEDSKCEGPCDQCGDYVNTLTWDI